MSKNTLDKLFGSRVRVKILKNTLRNYPADFSVSELARRIQEPAKSVSREVSNLIKLDLIKTKGR